MSTFLYSFEDLESKDISSQDYLKLEVSKITIAKVVRVLLSNINFIQRNGATRSDVSCTNKKMYKQKGTGSARHNDKSAPQFRGGSVSHSNNTVARKLTINRQEKDKVKKFLLSSFLNSDNHSWFTCNYESLKSRNISSFTKKFLLKKKVLFITSPANLLLLSRSTRNIENCLAKSYENVSVLDLLKYDCITIDYSLKNEIETKYAKV